MFLSPRVHEPEGDAEGYSGTVMGLYSDSEEH